MTRRIERALLLAGLLAFATPVVVAIGAANAFGYDESVYAQLTRHWLTGAPASGWDIHRPPGLSVLGLLPQALFPATEWAPRFVGALAGVGLVGAGWWAARTGGGPMAGLIAALALAAAGPLQVESSMFLTDVPSALVLLVLAVLVWRHLHGPKPIPPSFALLGMLAAAAFYIRYGAVIELAGLAAAAAVVAPRKLLASWRAIAGALAVFAAALVPHVAIAMTETGTPWGILASAASAAGGGTGLPLVTYLAWFPWRLIGPLGAAVALAGIAAALWHSDSDTGFARFVGVAALVPMLVLGTIIHAEARYLLFPITLLVVLGSVQLAVHFDRSARLASVAIGSVAVAALVLAGATTWLEMRDRSDSFDWKRDAGRDISAVVGSLEDADCSILTADVPILSWYSGCSAVNYLTGPETDRVSLLTGLHRFVVVRTDGHNQPSPEAVAELIGSADVWRTYVTGRGETAAVVYLLR